MKTYQVNKTAKTPEMLGDWNGEVWGSVTGVTLDDFHEQSSDHHPNVQVKMTYDDAGIYIHFRVQDQYVIAKFNERQGMVCRDSCAEFFVQPVEGKGYFNFEINCGGNVLLYHTTKPRQIDEPVSNEWLDQMKIYHSLPAVIKKEIVEPTVWQIEYFVPWGLFEAYVGELSEQKPKEGKGVKWRGNFYKCADESSHPHWGMWNDVGKKLDFHQPDKFGEIVFE
ncbi:carbohydrate-binding family 9-like protein [Planctomycetota bacterium]|nr:carbohydrate-binding family 9-like protein [Planctomycetota bacterium]